MSALDGSSLRGVGLSNTLHSEVASFLPLPSLPVFCGAVDQELQLFDEPRSLNRNDVLAQASKIADLLGNTDVSYLSLRDDTVPPQHSFLEPLDLYDRVLHCNPEAFECIAPGPIKEQIQKVNVCDEKFVEQSVPVSSAAQRDNGRIHDHHFNHHLPVNDALTSSHKKFKGKKKGSDRTSSSVEPIPSELQDAAIKGFCEVLENFCSEAEIPSDDQDEMEWLSLPVADLRKLVNEIMSIRTKNILHLVPVGTLARLLRVLDHQIHRAEGLSVDELQHSDSDLVSSIFCALESIHAALAVMAHNDMPKQIYKEEAIERILEFSRHQIMDVMSASDPLYRAMHKPSENCEVDGDEDEEFDADFCSASKRRRTSRGTKVRKTGTNRVSAAVNAITQKLCTILGFLKDLLLIERLSDSCILQLLKTCFTTFLVDNIQLLQLKAISLISAVFSSYKEHCTYVVDETLQLFWKLPSSKRAMRAYHLPDEEQRQIQMVTALLIQLVQCSANLPESFRRPSNGNPMLEVATDASYFNKCHAAVTEACCLFWSRVLQRFASVKSQDASELKVTMENLVMDLLATLNLPEYPATAPILEVLCVLLLQNAGPKSKDIAARSMAIDILGTIAARLKHNAVLCSKDTFWIIKELESGEKVGCRYPKDACSICLSGQVESLFGCQSCQRLFHAECMGVAEDEVPHRGWYCQFCQCKRQLLVLQEYCKAQYKDFEQMHPLRSSEKSSTDLIKKVEIVQQMLLNYLQDDGSADDVHLFVRWFYLCLWYKDDPNGKEKFMYYLARLKSKDIVRDSGAVSSILTRNSVKKITLALGQNNSFSRGFDKILALLLVSLRENSPVIRAKALRAVSIIVEADPEVLREKHVQLAVEGRFCDSAISVREAALELVGRHIASHVDVGVQYFEKVAERTKDTGVSVRKRAIRIIRDMCTSNPNFSEFTSACVEIISRVSDDEASIQDLVCKTFYEFWFEEPPSSQTQFFEDGSSVPVEVVKKTEQMVEMLKRMPNHQLLITIIKRNLGLDFVPQSAKAVGINPISLASVRKRCELMCKCLLERILQVEEMNGEEVELHSHPYVLVLHAFCVVDPTLCAPASNPSQFVVTLQPYLKSQVDNRVVANLLESIIFVIDAVLPLLRKLPQSVSEELEQDLKYMIIRHSFLTVVHACIKCLCSLSKLAGKGSTVVEYLIQLFYKRLDSLGLDNLQVVGRSLFCLGLLIRYGNSLLSGPSSGNKNLDVASSLSLFKKYLQVEDFGIKARSLQALGFLLIARPEFMLENDIGKILVATLSSHTDFRLKIQALQNIYDYLLDAEGQMETDQTSIENVAHLSVDGGRSVPVAAGAGDTNMCGGIIQLYWNNVLGRCLDTNELVRQSAVKIVEVVLRQGLVHPITCVPYLIALETDPLELNSKLAHQLLMDMNIKYPAFFESRLGDGLQMSFIFMRSINSSPENLDPKVQSKVFGNIKGKSDGGSSSFSRHGVSRIYKLVRSNRIARNKFMYSVVRKFDSPSWNETVVHFLMYCTELLALLPFTSPDEPLYLIFAINRVVQVRAGPIEANMKALMHLLQGHVEKASQENGIIQNGMVEQETTDQSSIILTTSTSSDSKIHSTRSSESHDISTDDLQNIKVDCLAAIALELLLKLKRHLKIVYSLNDARCQAYSPTEPLKPGEVLSRQNISFNIDDIHINLPTTSQEFVLRYQGFKYALKEDTVDYSTYTANVKKRPPPRTRKPSRVTTRNINYYEDDDDDDDDGDEDYSGGKRSSSRRGSSSRGRQRL